MALVLGTGCSSSPDEQVLTGKVSTSGALAVRAVSGSQVVTATQVRSDGSFTLTLPADGVRYRLEVLTTSGVRHVFSKTGGALADLSFRVCQPTDPYDMGGIGGGSVPGDPGTGGGSPDCDPMTDMYCTPPWPGCEDPMDPNCQPPDPWPCMDPSDPNCGGTMCGPNDPDCPTEPPCADPMDPNCPWPKPCAVGDPTCNEPCLDPTSPNCTPCSNPMDPTCGLPPPPGCSDPMDPYCFCDAGGDCPDPWCDYPGTGMEPNTSSPGADIYECPPPPPEPCLDPMDPTTCTNPCENDPAACGCAMEDPNCWPTPMPPECDEMGNMCEPGGPGGMTPENPPGDFGCTDDEPTMDDPVTGSPSNDDPMPEPGEPIGL
ncbi:MAG: hypothetical protein ACKV2T_16600 [Kofleriaceae bacterium]